MEKIPKKITKNFNLKEIYEGYKFSGDKVSDEVKGSYYIFTGSSGSKNSKSSKSDDMASYLSQIVYISSDAKNYEDLLYISESDRYVPQISLKKIYGRDYIKFDDYGTAFISVTRHSANQSGILMFSPVNGSKTFFALPEDFKFVSDFDISNNGKYIVVNGYNGGTNYSHQAFLFNTEEPDSQPEELLYMLSEELSSIAFNPENQTFYMMVAFYKPDAPFDESCGFVVLRPHHQKYSGEAMQFYDRTNVKNCENVDFWYNIFLRNESDGCLYLSNYKDSEDSKVYRIEDEGDFIDAEEVPEISFITLRKNISTVYKVSMKSTPLGLYLKDANEITYLFQNGKVTETVDGDVDQKLEEYNQKLLSENSRINPEVQIKKLKNLVILLSVAAGILVICIFILILVFISRRKKIYQKILQKKMLAFQESERAKLSRDIHDSVVQDIRAIRLQTEMIDVGENQKAISQKERTIDDITQTIVKMRNICYNLTPAELMTHKESDSAELELISIYDSLCQQFYVKSKIPCAMQIDEKLVYPKFNKDVTLHLVRIFQEILNNIEKHSYATNVNVLVRNKTENDENYLVIFVIDDGIGCNIEQVLKNRKKNHFGMTNMKERMDLIGGQIEFFSAENEGMKIKLTVKM